MAEPFRFNYAEATLENWNQARKLKEQQRQFDLEQGRLQRQESLANLIRMRDLDIAQENMQTSRMNALTNVAEAKANIGTNYDVIDSDKYIPSVNGTLIRPNNSIVIDELYPGKILTPKEPVAKPVKPDDVFLRYGKIPGSPYEGEIYGYKDGDKEVITRFEQYKPNDNSFSEMFKWMARKDELEKQAAATLKKQAIYNQVMDSRTELKVDDKTGKEIPGSAEYKVKIGNTIKRTNDEAELRQWAINEAEKTGLPGKINQWGRIREGDATTTLDQADYEKKVRKPKEQTTSKKIMTKSEFITDYIKEEGKSPTEEELKYFNKQGLWR